MWWKIKLAIGGCSGLNAAEQTHTEPLLTRYRAVRPTTASLLQRQPHRMCSVTERLMTEAGVISALVSVGATEALDDVSDWEAQSPQNSSAGFDAPIDCFQRCEHT